MMFVAREAGVNSTTSAITRSSEIAGVFEIARIVWSQKRTALAAFLALIGVVFVACSVITPTYEASTLLVVGQNALDGSPEALQSTAEISTTLARIVESEEVIRQAVEKVGLTKLVGPINSPLTLRDAPGIRDILSFFTARSRRETTALDRAIPAISSALEVRRQPSSNIIRISFRHEDPVTAANFVDAVAQSFVDRQLVLFSRPGAAEFYQHQKDKFDEEIRRASDELQAFVTANRIYLIDDERQLLLRRASGLSAALATTRGSIADKTGQKETLTIQLRALKPVTQSPFVSSLLNALGSNDHSERNGSGTTPRTNALPDERGLSDTPPLLMTRVYQDAMLALFKVNAELMGLANLQQEQAEELQRLNAALGELSSKEAEFAKLKRILAQASQNSDIYAKRTVEERISAESSAAKFSKVKIVQPAYAPLKPSFPNYRLFAGLGLAAGLVAAVAVALCADTLARREPATNTSPSTQLVPLGNPELPTKRRRQDGKLEETTQDGQQRWAQTIETSEPFEARRCRLAQYSGLPTKLTLNGSKYLGTVLAVKEVRSEEAKRWIVRIELHPVRLTLA
jgi:uncharacterized protein involved in exopolysaccharide biosynthesis